MNKPPKTKANTPAAEKPAPSPNDELPKAAPGEVGGRKGPEPTRYGDWEKDGIATDF